MSTVFSWASLIPAGPEIFLTVAALLLLIIGVYQKKDSTHIIAAGSLLAFIGAIVLLLNQSWDTVYALNGFFVLDSFAGYLKIMVLLCLIAVTLLSTSYLYNERIARFEYPIIVMLAGVGMLLMLSANNLLAVYMGLELQSLSLYVLAAIQRNHVKSSEAGLKYFVLGALASGMLLFGISLIYGYTGGISFDAIKLSLEQPAGTGLIVGMVFLLIGVAFKISAVPFHMWTPDVYEGAPTSVTALFAIVPKVAAIGLLIRLLYEPFQALMPEWQQIIWFLSAASMVVGGFAAIKQTNIKRLMAYSSIGNMGYALMGVVAGTQGGVGAVVLYMAIYMIMSAGVFGIILKMRRDGLAVENILDLSGLSRTKPLMAYAMAFLMFSMSGIPPLAGFFGKLLVFQTAVASGFYVLAVIGVLSSVVAAYYYLRVIKVMFFDEPAPAFDGNGCWAVRIVVTLSVLFNLLFIFKPEFLIESSFQAAAVLFTQ